MKKTFEELDKEFDESLTQEERDSDTCLTWSDESLGRAVKHFRQLFENEKLDKNGLECLLGTTAAYQLIHMATMTNATYLKITMEGVSMSGERVGDWDIIAKKRVAKKKT